VSERPEVGVVIVTWNSGDGLAECLRSLAANPPSVAWEAIVVDNGSTDGSIELAKSEFPWLRVIANPRNRGLAAANNQGIVASAAPLVLISNPDVLYRRGAIDALLDLMRRRRRAAFAVAKLLHPDGGLQTSVGDLPSAAEALLGRRFSWRWRNAPASGVWWHGWSHDEERAIGHGAEACYLVRRAAVGEIGLQDERFVLDWEGLDWSARAWEAGWEIWFSPAAEVVHLGGMSVRRARGRWIASTHLGMYLYLSPRVPMWLRPPLGALIASRMLVKLLASALDQRTYQLAHRRTDLG
jgi:GT2 family glycosyltransferase